MSKVTCEICGTAYPDTAELCPICGTAKPEQSGETSGAEESTGYAYVKGGRFSQSNVRKHNSGKKELPRVVEEEKPARAEKKEEAPQRSRRTRPEEEEEPADVQPSNIGLIVIVVILLLAIIALCGYVAMRFIDMNNAKNNTTQSTQPSGSDPLEDIACTGLSVAGDVTSYTFTSLDQSWMVQLVAEPADTTDLISWEYDETLVKVTSNGNFWTITPVGIGTAEVVVTCGDQSVTLTVDCSLTNLPCTGVTFTGPESYDFTDVNQSFTLGVTCTPATTTEELVWSYDETVINLTPSEEGWVVIPIATGNTTLTATCGAYSASMNITVNLETNFVLEWAIDPYKGVYDITINGYGSKELIYIAPDGMDISRISFSSSDESVATVEKGYVYVWTNGVVTITAAYGNQVITMTVRAKNVEAPTEDAKYVLSHTDVTISIDESFKLTLKDIATGVAIEGESFSVSEDGYLTVDEKGRVTGVAAGTVTIIVEYEGVQYKCIVRVKTA